MFPKGMIPGEDIIYSWYTIAVALAFGFVLGLRNYMRGPQCMSQVQMKKKMVIVTGASAGIGLETARELAARGAKVIIACKDEVKGKQAMEDVIATAKSKAVRFMQLDLSSLQSVRDFVEKFKAKYDKLDVLVNNASVMYHPEAKTSEGNEMHFCVNYLGHFLLTHLLLDVMKSSAPARIINVVCPAYQLAEPDFSDIICENKEYKAPEAYALSKLAVVLHTRQLARELEGTNVTVNMAYPGLCFTNLYRNMPFMKSMVIAVTFKPVMWYLMKGARDGAQTIVNCAVAAEEEGVSGKYYADLRMQEPHEKATNDEAAEALWKQSITMTGVKPIESAT